MKYLLVDIDGVVADGHKLLLRQLNRANNWRLTDEDIPCYDAIVRDIDFGKELCHKLEDPCWVLAVPPTPGASRVLNRLWKDGWDIQLVTARKTTAADALEKWCSIHGIPGGGSIKYASGPDRMTLFVNDPKKYTLIDDNVETCNSWASYGKRVLLFDRPWNQNGAAVPETVYNWRDVWRKLSRPSLWD